MDIYYGPRYIDDETLIDTYEKLGYESPLDSEICPTPVKGLNDDETETADGYVSTLFEVSDNPQVLDRFSA